ncbi:PAS domain S-box protein [Blastopirellula retiformator]|uniref:histidine kinase n=1 Tax=Blastopirellula retiformator TaxID=2527970 RepID=A0A5C5V279_9BACT|nr:PAS domain S-box protein [Blastopirellula retiformator]TWT32714.1 Sensor protein FixL [Blastopirellula retiformator]
MPDEYRILIIEDERSHAILMSRALNTFSSQFEVIIASSLEKARQEIVQRRPDLALVDNMLPDGRGVDLLSHRRPEDQQFPIVVMTSYGDERTAVEALKRGAIDYVVKTEHFFSELPRIAERAIRQWQLICDKRDAELALRNSERRYRALVDNSPVPILVHSMEKVVLANEKAVECLGGTSDADLIGRPIEDFIVPDERQSVRERISSLYKGEPTTAAEQHMLCVDGRTIDVSVAGTPIDYLGHPACQIVFLDITERKRAELALKIRERAIASTTNGVFIVSLSENEPQLVYGNPALEVMLGVAPGMLEGKSLDVFRADPREAEQLRQLNWGIVNGGAMQETLRLARAEGEFGWCEISIAPVRGEKGIVTHVVGVVNDIAEKILADDELRRRNMELAHVARLSTLGEIVAGIAHEVNQPLYAISNYGSTCLNLLKSQREDREENITHCITRIVDQATRAGEIIRRLRNFASRTDPKLEDRDVHELIHDSVELIAPMIRDSDVFVQYELPDQLPPVTVDAIQIQQVLINLVTNACEAMKAISESKTVTISAQVSDDLVEFCVRDSGPGLPGNVDIFEAFRTTKEGGMGMGLAISRSIIELHGGKIWCQPSAEGAEFRFTLPTASEPTEEEHANDTNRVHH